MSPVPIWVVTGLMGGIDEGVSVEGRREGGI